MRVLLLSQYFFPEVGATQTRMYEFARALAGQGCDVDVLAEFPNHPTGVIPSSFRGKWFDRDLSHPFKVARVWVFARPRKTFWTRLAFYGSFLAMSIVGSFRLADRYDVVVATSPPLPVALAGYVISRLKRAAFVMDVRDLWPKAARALGELRDGWVYAAAERVEEALYRRAQRITVTTDAFRRDIAARVAGTAPKIDLVPNGTLDDVFNPCRGDAGLRSQLGLTDAFVVGYVGLHGIAQGLDTVLDAAGQLQVLDPHIRFLFVGEGPQKADLMARAASHGLATVQFLPQVTLEVSGHYMNVADALVVPLTADPAFEMFVPSKLFDAMASAKPVLLMVAGEARDILERAQAGLFVPPGDAAALSDAILALRRDRVRSRAMGDRGRAFVLKEYRRADQAQRFAAIVSAAAAARGKTAVTVEPRCAE